MHPFSRSLQPAANLDEVGAVYNLFAVVVNAYLFELGSVLFECLTDFGQTFIFAFSVHAPALAPFASYAAGFVAVNEYGVLQGH